MLRVVQAGRLPLDGGVRFQPLDPSLPRVAAQRPLALAILADYGNPVLPEDQVSAIVDWTARIAIHGHSGLRLPLPYATGTATLPTGKTWEDVQAKLTAAQQITDNVFWTAFLNDGTVILDKLLGTLNIATGARAADGAMVQVVNGAQAHYRYRTIDTVRSVWCTHQHNICTVLLAALGMPSMLTHQTGHDPLRVQYGLSGEWGYWCATYNEHYSLTGSTRPLDMLELRDLTQRGDLSLIRRQTHTGPVWDAPQYVSASYLLDRPEGWPQVGVSLDSRIVPGRVNRVDLAISDPALAASGHVLAGWTQVSEARATPRIGAYLYGEPRAGLGVVTMQVRSSAPGTASFVLRAGGIETVYPADVTIGVPQVTVRVREGAGRVTVRPVTGQGAQGAPVTLDV